MSGGALLANTLGTAGITITNSQFYNNGTGSAGGMLIYTNGPVIINGSTFSHNKTNASLNMPGLNISIQASSLTIKNSDISFNQNDGLLTERLAGSITLDHVYLRSNLKNGMYLQTSSNITLKNVDSSGNLYNGAVLDTCWGSPCATTGSGKVTISNSHFDGNGNQNAGLSSLFIYARGAISLSGVTADGNGQVLTPSAGATIWAHDSQLASSVSVSNSQFQDNQGSGLVILTKGAITLSSVSIFRSATAYGANLDNSFGTAGVTIKGTAAAMNYFCQNGNFSGADDDGLFINTNGSISLSYIKVDENKWSGFDFFGMKPINITIKYGSFNFNEAYGVNLETQGSFTLSDIDASGNGFNGLYLHNQNAPTPKNVKLTNVQIHDNGSLAGVEVSSKGFVTLSGAEVYDQAGSGVSLFGTAGVTVLNARVHDNLGKGVLINSNGSIKLTNVFSGSNGWGAILSSGSTVTISNGTFNENSNSGLLINQSRNINIAKSEFDGNGYLGAMLDNTFLTPAFSTIKITQCKFTGNGTGGVVSCHAEP